MLKYTVDKTNFTLAGTLGLPASVQLMGRKEACCASCLALAMELAID